MAELQLLGRLNRWILLLVPALLVSGVVADALAPARPVTVDDALADFRAAQASPASQAPPTDAPAPGDPGVVAGGGTDALAGDPGAGSGAVPSPEAGTSGDSAVVAAGAADPAESARAGSEAGPAPAAGGTPGGPGGGQEPAAAGAGPGAGGSSSAPPQGTAPAGQAAAPQQSSQPAPAPQGDPRALPEPGVYTYATTGQESVDVGGTTHTYPSETTVAVHREGCGVRMRWQPLRERFDEDYICPSEAGADLLRITSHHEFFGQAKTDVYDCQDALVRPADERPGVVWQGSCTGQDGTQAAVRGTVVGFEDLAVGAEHVAVVHLRYDVRFTGPTTGDRVAERWLRRSDGLPIRSTATMQVTTQGPTGRVAYDEHFDLRLRSTRPQR